MSLGKDVIINSNDTSDQILSDISCFRELIKEKRFLSLSFESVEEYLILLEESAKILSRKEENVMFFLAAAVSDFYIPKEKMEVHKIQSDSGLNLSLDQVPKRLQHLTSTWAPTAYVVSFKLETDMSILIDKACRAIVKYGVHLVVANKLDVSMTLLPFFIFTYAHFILVHLIYH